MSTFSQIAMMTALAAAACALEAPAGAQESRWSSAPAGDGAPPCSGELFDYGPVWPDPTIEIIVLDHYGAEGPILVDPSDYERAARDVALILPDIGLASAEHFPGWVQTDIIIGTEAPGECVTCANQFYQGSMRQIGGPGFPFYLVTFPRAANMYAMAREYLACPEVTSASPNGIGCAGSCCVNRWDYTVRADGAWVWTIIQDESPSIGICRRIGEWRVAVSAGGVVTVTCYADCDVSGGLDFFDFLCFQDAFAAGDRYADCDDSGAVDFFDFLCFQNGFAAGCP
jgi:hypothetical protein